MTRNLLLTAATVLALAWARAASACDGAASHDVVITFDGQRFTVTNVGREWVQVDFAAFGTTYNLQLAPGQSDTPSTGGTFNLPMNGYQSCVATPLPVAVSGVSTFPRR
jgi:hypothetical protein